MLSQLFKVPWVGIEPTLQRNRILNPAYLMVNLAKYTYNQLINKYLILIDFI